MRHLGTRTCRSFKQIIPAKLLKTKNDQNDGKDRRCRGCRRRSCIKSPAGKTINAASVKKATATSQLIFKLERPILPSLSLVLWKDEETDLAGASGVKTICQPSFSQNTTVPGLPHDKLGGGRLNQRQNKSTTIFWQLMDHCKQYVQMGRD
jgi:hypothetical protein